MTNEERLLRAILALLCAMARWMFDGPRQDYRTRATWFGLRNGIEAAEKELQQ